MAVALNHIARQPLESARPFARRATRPAPEVLGAPVFRDVLVRERRRAERFGDPFLTLLVELESGATPLAQLPWDAVLDAMAAIKRESDLLGWFEPGVVLGLVVPESRDLNLVSAVERRLRAELARRLDAAALRLVSMRWYAHGVQPGPEDRSVAAVDLLLEALPEDRRARGPELAKRVLDVVVSATLLVLLAPLIGVVAALVTLTSRGPALFRQERVGQRARPFTMLKFRTMYTGAGHASHQAYVTWFITASGNQANGGDALFKMENDPRVTRVGRLLRKSSLDELPQLWNVLRGDMSLVGPRPPLQFEVDRYQPWHRRRVLDARPGMTGLWQVKGRSRTTFDEMVRLDLRYARHRSLWLDIKILAATPMAVISGKGAC